MNNFDFDVLTANSSLAAMELPVYDESIERPVRLTIKHPGGVGDILHDADGGSWLRGNIVESDKEVAIPSSELQYVAIA